MKANAAACAAGVQHTKVRLANPQHKPDTFAVIPRMHVPQPVPTMKWDSATPSVPLLSLQTDEDSSEDFIEDHDITRERTGDREG